MKVTLEDLVERVKVLEDTVGFGQAKTEEPKSVKESEPPEVVKPPEKKTKPKTKPKSKKKK